MTSPAAQLTFVVALNELGRQRQMRTELTSFLKKEHVAIVEGAGRSAVTVKMTEQTRAKLQKRLSFATVEPLRELKLLGDPPSTTP